MCSSLSNGGAPPQEEEDEPPEEVILDSRPFCFFCRGSYQPGELGEGEDQGQDLHPLFHNVGVRESKVLLKTMTEEEGSRKKRKLNEVQFRTFQCPSCQGKVGKLLNSLDSPKRLKKVLKVLKTGDDKAEEELSFPKATPFQQKLIHALRDNLKRKIEVKIKYLEFRSLESQAQEDFSSAPTTPSPAKESNGSGKSPNVKKKKKESPEEPPKEDFEVSPLPPEDENEVSTPKKRKKKRSSDADGATTPKKRRSSTPHLRRNREPCLFCDSTILPDRHSQLTHSLSVHPESLFKDLQPPSMTPAVFRVALKAAFAKEIKVKRGKLRCRPCSLMYAERRNLLVHLISKHRPQIEERLKVELNQVPQKMKDKTSIKCDHCNKMVCDSRQLDIHVNSHHPEVLFASVKPDHMSTLEFRRFCSLAMNKELPKQCLRVEEAKGDGVTVVGKWECCYCDQHFVSTRSLVRHVVRMHVYWMSEFLEEQLGQVKG